MISSNAQDSFDRIFRKAVQSRLVLNAGDTCQIVAGQADAASASDAQIVILTISSMTFRLLLALRFDEQASTRDYFAGSASGRSLQESCLETGNLCCGAINQELIQSFPDLGMSTPYQLSARCIPHLEVLKPDYLASYAVTINDAVQVAAMVCVCAHAPIDFVVDVSTATESSGELELF